MVRANALSGWRSRPGLVASVVGGLLAAALWPTTLAGAAAPPQPTYATAVVDGDPAEWDLTTDRFAEMAHTGSSAVGALYLRYDCGSHVLFALVLSNGGRVFLQGRPEEAYLRIDDTGKLVSGESGDDGTPPDFAWVDPDGELTRGFEASGIVAPGSHTIRAHILMADSSADGYETIDTVPRTTQLVLECPVAVVPSSSASGGVGPITSSPSASPASPSSSPSGGVGPITSPSASAGQVGGVQGTPRLTPPPTDTEAAAPARSSWALALLGLAVVASGALLSARRTARLRRRS